MARVAGRTAGWFADPAGRFRFRYWTGDQWTDQVLDGKTREESTDVLETHLRAVEPRPVLPSLPEPGIGDRTLADAPPNVYAQADAAGREADAETEVAPGRKLRIPRPSMTLVVILIVAGLGAGLAFWVLGQADNAAKPESAVNEFIDRGITGPAPVGSQRLPAATAEEIPVAFTTDPAPAGYHRTNVLGLSVPLPEDWHAFNPRSPAFHAVAERVGMPLSTYERLRLFVSDAGVGQTAVTVSTSAVPQDVLDSPQEVADALSTQPAVVSGSVTARTVTVGHARSLRVEAAVVERFGGGATEPVYSQTYFVPVGGRVVTIRFETPTDRSGDPTIDTIVGHVTRAG